MPTPEETAKAEAEAKAKADVEAKAKAEAEAKAEADRIAKLSPEELRDYNERLKKEAISHRLDTKAEREKREAAEKELATLRAEKAERERKELEAQGAFKEIASKAQAERDAAFAERDALRVKAEKYESSLTAEETALKAELGDAAAEMDLSALPLEARVSTLRTVAKIARSRAAQTPPDVKTPDATKGNPKASAKETEARAAIRNDATLTDLQKARKLRSLK